MRRGDIKKVKSLFLHETEINAQDENGDTLLHIAAKHAQGVVFNFLLKQKDISISLKMNTEYGLYLKEIRLKIKTTSEKMGQNPFYILCNSPELREAAVEIISKIFEYYNRYPKLASTRELDEILPKMREFRNKQYHETDSRSSAGPIEYLVTPNSDSDVLDLLEKLCAIFSPQKLYSSENFFSGSSASHSDFSNNASTSSGRNVRYGKSSWD